MNGIPENVPVVRQPPSVCEAPHELLLSTGALTRVTKGTGHWEGAFTPTGSPNIPQQAHCCCLPGVSGQLTTYNSEKQTSVAIHPQGWQRCRPPLFNVAAPLTEPQPGWRTA